MLPAVHACQAEKDVYIEKPMTLTIREGRQLVNAARKFQRVVQTGSQQRSIPRNQLAAQLVLNGAIGKVHTVITANFESPWECALPAQPIPRGLDWEHLVRPDRGSALQHRHRNTTRPTRAGSRSGPGPAVK